MKDKILTLIIGALIGAIITTVVFLVIDSTKTSENSNNMRRGPGGEMGNFTPGEMPSGGRGPMSKSSSNSNSTDGNSTESDMEMPEPPTDDGNGPQGNGEEPPAKPDGENQTTTNS